jgi:hypothetical protein
MSTQNPYDAPRENDFNEAQIVTSRSLQIRRIDVASCAQTLGALYALIGLIAGVFFSIAAIVTAAGKGPPALFGVFAVVILPLLYGFMGLLAGAIVAALYNLVASVVGGIKIDLR